MFLEILSLCCVFVEVSLAGGVGLLLRHNCAQFKQELSLAVTIGHVACLPNFLVFDLKICL